MRCSREATAHQRTALAVQKLKMEIIRELYVKTVNENLVRH
jgi:hypothetical protein